MIAISISMANMAPYWVLVILWILAGLGQSYTEMPSQILIAENTDLPQQGRVYGAHFAWSHLWWGFGYLIAGVTGTYFTQNEFLIGSMLSIALLVALCTYEYRFRESHS